MTTYNYNYDIATSRAKVIFKLLLRWRGSVWQAVWIELLIWLFLYGIMSIIYRLALTESQQVTFEKIALFCNNRMSYIPLNFMLSFFVTTVVNRWITQFANLGMIDNIALFTSSFVKGSDERGRQLRRNIVRYCVLSQALVFRDIHLGVRKRFPTLDTLVASGFMMKHEKEKFEECKSRYAKYWLPFNWALHLLNKARQENRMDGEIAQNAVAMEIRQFRTGLSLIWTYDWVPLPIMYPQLVYLAVHTYFFVCLFARQFIIRPGAVNQTEIDLYFPIMSTLEFVFYMGWLKVAMALLNPFGDDDEDFDCNFLLDRNLTISLTSVDEAFDDVPDVLPDVFYNDIVNPLYSQDSAARNVNFYTGSANKAELPESVTEITMVPHPANERIDRYIQRPARRRRTSIVTVAREPLVREERTPSLSSHVINVFRRRKSSSIRSADISAARKPRSSTDIGIISPSTLTVPNGAAAYQNPTFVHIDEAPEENHENGPTHHYYSGNLAMGWYYSLAFAKMITFAFNDAYFYNSDNLRGIQMGYEGLSNEERAQLNEEYDRRDGERMGVRCIKWFSTNYNEEYKCLVAENRSLASSPLTLLVLGNSWAQNIMRIVQDECQDVFSSMYISATGACEPLYRTIYPGYDCTIDGIFQTAARQFKPDVVFIFTRHITGLEIANGTNPFDDDNFATAVRRLRALETVAKKKIYILDAFPLVQRRITQILKDYLRTGRPFKDSEIVDFGSGYLIAKQRMDRLAQICSKCEIFDFANQFYFNGEFKVYDPKYYMAFLGEGLHPTPAAWERVRPQINHICHHLNLGK